MAAVSVVACVLLLPLPSLAQQTRQVLHSSHVRPAVRSGQAAQVGVLPKDEQLHIAIMLPLRNQAELGRLLGQLYDPSSPEYRKFLTVEEFTRRFGPTAQDFQAVVDFAKAKGLTVKDRPANRMVVSVTGSVAQLEKAFDVSMKVYQHPTEERTFYSPDREPALELNVAVSHIAGLNNYSIPRPMLKKSASLQAVGNVSGSGPAGSYLGSDMRAAYYGGTALTGSGQVVGLIEFDGYYINDVNATFEGAGQTYSVPITNVLLDGLDGLPRSLDAEPVLDIVQAIGMAPGLSEVRVYIGTNDVDMFNAMASENIAKQISVSWGWLPDDPAMVDPIFQEMAVQGQSVFVASGDRGAFDESVSRFSYPADDAYVTSVGGTHLETNGAGGSWVSETVWNTPEYRAGSGGGISPNDIALPTWQSGLATALNGGSTVLRNAPDVAMEADFDNFFCEQVGCGVGGAGTSFAAPRWAAFMALVNQQAEANGRPPVGFLNPTLYAIGRGPDYAANLHDVTIGNNNCCGQALFFNAVPGYDLATGWGSPTGQAMIDTLAGAPLPRFMLGALPSRVTLYLGQSTSSVISVTNVAGFSGNVTLSASGLPRGVTQAWSVNPTTATSVLTLTASDTTPVGAYKVTITGTSGSLKATVPLALTVSAPGFTLSSTYSTSVARNAVYLYAGGSNTTEITVTQNGGFTGAVTLGATGLPSGGTASFSPNPSTGLSTLTLGVPLSARPGAYLVTVTGTSGNVTASTAFPVQVEVPFSLSAGTLFLWQGSSGAAPVTVTGLNGSAGSVYLAAPSLPNGVSVSFSPNPTTDTSVATVTVGGAANVGLEYIMVTGTSGTLTTSTTLSVFIQPTLTVVLAGSGAGTVTSSDGALNCGSTCRAAFLNSPATLTAFAAPGSVFTGWSGGCSGVATTCNVTLFGSEAVIASFQSTTAPRAINAGGGASGSFAADSGFSGGTAVSYTNSVDTSLLPVPAPPKAVLQSQRYGVMTYVFPGYAPGSTHRLALYFVENYVTGPRQRLFNVSINGTRVLTGFDVFAAAGKQFRAVEKDFQASADSNGRIVIQFTNGGANNPEVNAIAIDQAPGTRSIDAGGPAAGSFSADVNVSGGSVASTTAAIDTSLIMAPVPPQVVFQTERYGTFTYTLPGYVPGSTHAVTLYFAESYWSSAGQRLFNVFINDSQVLNGFDILAAAGGKNKAIEKVFGTVANNSGQIVIRFSGGTADRPKVDGIAVDQVPNYQVLTVDVSGSGVGTVTSSPAGIYCPTTCGAGYPEGTVVTLTAVAAPGSVFEGWSGGCYGPDPVCTMVLGPYTYMSNALFSSLANLIVSKAGTGTGTVKSWPEGIDCGSSCSVTYPNGTDVVLMAIPDVDSTLANWSGCAIIDGVLCQVRIDGLTAVAVTFNRTASIPRVAINAGGGAIAPFTADQYFSGGTVATPTTAAIDMSLLPAPAPPSAIFQTERYGPMVYTIPGYVPGSSRMVTLYFAETYWKVSGKRRFDVWINGRKVLADFDVLATAGAANKAIQQAFSTVADSGGQIVIQFVSGSADLPKLSGLLVQ